MEPSCTYVIVLGALTHVSPACFCIGPAQNIIGRDSNICKQRFASQGFKWLFFFLINLELEVTGKMPFLFKLNVI